MAMVDLWCPWCAKGMKMSDVRGEDGQLLWPDYHYDDDPDLVLDCQSLPLRLCVIARAEREKRVVFSVKDKLDYGKPPQTIRFELAGIQKPTMGDYFLREDGTMYQWTFKGYALKAHPVYRLVEGAKTDGTS